MGTPIPRRHLLVAVAAGAGALSLTTACTESTTPALPTRAAPTAPDPLFAVLQERARLVEAYDAAGLQHPQLLPRLLPLRRQTEEQVVALRLALALGEPTPRPTTSGSTPSGSTPSGSSPSGSSPSESTPSESTSSESTSSGSSTSGASGSPSVSAVPVDPAATLADLRSAVTASGATAAALCETTTTERAPFVGSLAAAAACHELLLA